MSVTSKMMEACGEAEGRLASELMQHEVQIERDILDPLNQLTEVKKNKKKQNNLHRRSAVLGSEVSLDVALVSHRSRFQTF